MPLNRAKTLFVLFYRDNIFADSVSRQVGVRSVNVALHSLPVVVIGRHHDCYWNEDRTDAERDRLHLRGHGRDPV